MNENPPGTTSANGVHGIAKKHNVGSLRPSQLITTFGVGAMVDLPHISALVMGLDEWPIANGYAREIREDRLLAAVQTRLGQQVSRLYAPPIAPETAGVPGRFDPNALVGIPASAFPRWVVCPSCKLLAPLDSGLFHLQTAGIFRPDRVRYVHTACGQSRRAPPVVPARFLVACENGHLDDFPWIEFVHRGDPCATPVLRLFEFEPSGEARDLVVKCESCGKTRPMSDAFGAKGKAAMPYCRGRRPHLRDFDPSGCECRVTTVPLGASHLWFPEILSALALPVRAEDRLSELIEAHWDVLGDVPGPETLDYLRTRGELAPLAGYPIDELWRAVEARRSRSSEAVTTSNGPMDLKTPEWEVFSSPSSAPPSPDLHLRPVNVPADFAQEIAQVVLVEHLREVQALIGFTRLESPAEAGVGVDAAQPKHMRLSAAAPGWVPASETRGEGIFIQFREERVWEWTTQPAVRQQGEAFLQAHIRWRTARGIEPPDASNPGMRYVLLHSFAHALMRRFSLECGYAAASLKERIYARNPEDETRPGEPMAGVLIYTAASDSEGTLGGLVSLGEPAQLERHIAAALHDALFCASDPLCAERTVESHALTLHAAACHACLFAPETACERGNRYLDRSVLVKTVERSAYPFFMQIE